MTEGWDWELRAAAEDTFETLDEIVDDEWRTPVEYLEPLSGPVFETQDRILSVGMFGPSR